MAGEGDTIVAALREADPDRYLSVLYAPAALRGDLASLYLFNAEIAAIRDRIHEPLPGEIRIQWWRDALRGGAGGGYPLAEALAAAIRKHRLPIDAFDRYLEARIFDLYDDPMPSRADLEGYCGETASAIIQLGGLMLDPEAAQACSGAAGHAGCAQAIAGLMRLMPRHVARGQCYVPAEMLAAAGTDRDGFVAGADPKAARRAIEMMVALGREHVREFEAAAASISPTLRSAFLPAALAGPYLDKVAAPGFDPLSAVADIAGVRRHWTMLRRATFGWK